VTVTPPGHTTGMCDICNGMTYEESLRRMHEIVVARSWAIQGVEASGYGRPWAYTIGLTEHFAHPELVMTGSTWPEDVAVLNELGDRIRAGEVFSAGAIVDCDRGPAALGRVHPGHLLRGLCASWTSYYEWRGFAPGALEVLQVVPVSASSPRREGELATFRPSPTSGGTNRAARRRAARGRP
jgi:hypothetical protein